MYGRELHYADNDLEPSSAIRGTAIALRVTPGELDIAVVAAPIEPNWHGDVLDTTRRAPPADLHVWPTVMSASHLAGRPIDAEVVVRRYANDQAQASGAGRRADSADATRGYAVDHWA